jgi:hypothetical protein
MEQFRISRALVLSFKCWVRNFIPFTLVAVLLHAPLLIWLVTVGLDPQSSAQRMVDHFFTYPIYIVTATSTVIPSLLTYRVVQELNGRKVSMWTSLRFGLRGLPPAILLALVLHLIHKLPVAGVLVSSIATCVYYVVAPAAVAERLGPLRAFARSAELTRGRRWGIYGLSLLLGVIALAILFVWIMPRIEHGFALAIASVVSSSIAFNVLYGLLGLYSGIVQAVSYALLRQDKDGTSLEELARVFE